MDGDQRNEYGASGTGSLPSLESEDVETSFITATEGEEEPAPHRSILGMVHEIIDGDADNEVPDDTGSVRSSRSMPVPAYLERRSDRLVGEGKDDPSRSPTPPPPSYDEAVAAPDYRLDTSADQTDDSQPADERDPAEEGHGEAEGLSPDEVAVVLKMQADRDSYLPERRGSYEEAMEMIDSGASNSNADKYISNSEIARVPEPRRVSRHISLTSVEEARSPPSENDYECTSCGPLNGLMTVICEYKHNMSSTRLILFSALFVGILGLILFVGLFPASFVYIEHYEIALAQSKMTNKVDRDTVYYPGCYVLGVDTKLVRFTGSVHSITDEMNIFTLDTIAITMKYSLQYFLRPKEVGKLYTMFMKDYDEVFQKIVKSSIRNLAGTSMTVDWFRFNRTHVEKTMHAMLRKRLGGNCCPDCCPDGCQSNAYCKECNNTNCDEGYHVDVRYFNLLSIGIPTEVFERYLRWTILDIEKEREFFYQEKTVIDKQTEQQTKNIKNHANEIVQEGKHKSDAIAVISVAEKEKQVQTSYVKALKSMYSRLNVTQEDHKVSLMMVRALEDNVANLYAGYGYEKNTIHAP